MRQITSVTGYLKREATSVPERDDLATDTVEGEVPPSPAPEAPAASPVGSAAVPAVFVVLWSSAFIAAVIGTDAAPPLLLTFSRFALAGLLLMAVALVSKSPWPKGRLLLHVVVTGLLMQAVQFGAFYTAISEGLPGGLVALIQGFNPVLIALMAGFLLGEQITRRQWFGFGVGGAGVALAVAGALDFSVTAIVLSFVGLLGLSAGTVYQKRFAQGADVRSSTAVHFLASAPVMLLMTLILEDPEVTDWGAFGGSLAWIVLINSVGTFLLLNFMLKKQDASRVGTLFFLTPAVTALLSWLVIDETLSVSAIAGLVLGGVGVLLASRK
ncbi:DMT family transporter [Streptomyces olivaceus]|uniref:DMT family transporter n=1 Tax=Streptomyces olivaceus TaxID=47716 RepID=A0ABS7W7Q6_STROV|nr:DMT family transporter [Streptomyces olivaceus]MBZ6096565.1 DMT family transporter [Streptomyces olivaceus]MBZ6117785.1 DMT family transporter [Streptomyces olivaceus]MBZ6153195.1 DMT family transporter [Streptomyces olivaceus]MBZ6293887.1 DMT family transporter [Streptomyces olivaceus]